MGPHVGRVRAFKIVGYLTVHVFENPFKMNNILRLLYFFFKYEIGTSKMAFLRRPNPNLRFL